MSRIVSFSQYINYFNNNKKTFLLNFPFCTFNTIVSYHDIQVLILVHLIFPFENIPREKDMHLLT